MFKTRKPQSELNTNYTAFMLLIHAKIQKNFMERFFPKLENAILGPSCFLKPQQKILPKKLSQFFNSTSNFMH